MHRIQNIECNEMHEEEKSIGYTATSRSCDFYVIFKGFCKVFLHKLVLKTAFLGLGWAQVYRSQLGLMP